MRPQLAILFLVAFSSFLRVGASRAARNVKNQQETHFEFDAYDDLWTEILSLFNPTDIADKIQRAPFLSNLIGMPSTKGTGRVRHTAQVSPGTPDRGPEFLQRSLQVLFFEEAGTLVQSFETIINSTVALSAALYTVLESASANSVISSNAPFTPLLNTVATFVAITWDDFRARFPLPATAPGHARRAKHVSEALECLQQLVVHPAKSHEIEQEEIESHLAHITPFLRDVGVLIGDMVELYPEAIEAFVLNVSAMLFPKAAFLRSLVVLYCFGPYVFGKDVISGWLPKHIFEALNV